MQFARPDRDTYIRIFGEEGDEVVTINARTSAAVTYPNDTFSRTLIFDINFCQLPVNHSFYILLDGGESLPLDGQYSNVCMYCMCTCECVRVHMCVCW